MRAGRCAFGAHRAPLQGKQVRLSSWRKLVMRNRLLWFLVCFSASGSSRVCSRRCTNEFPHRRAAARAPLPEGEGRVRAFALVFFALFVPVLCHAQDVVRSPFTDQTGAETEPVVVSATRF